MNKEEILHKLNDIFKEILDNNSIEIVEGTSANDIEEWDSLSNIEIIVAVEKHFNLKFTSSDIESWQNVGDMCNDILKRVN